MQNVSLIVFISTSILDLKARVQHTKQVISLESYRNQDLSGYINNTKMGKLYTKLRIKDTRQENLLTSLRILITKVRIHHTKQGDLVTKLRNYKGMRRNSYALGMSADELPRYWKKVRMAG